MSERSKNRYKVVLETGDVHAGLTILGVAKPARLTEKVAYFVRHGCCGKEAVATYTTIRLREHRNITQCRSCSAKVHNQREGGNPKTEHDGALLKAPEHEKRRKAAPTGRYLNAIWDAAMEGNRVRRMA